MNKTLIAIALAATMASGSAFATCPQGCPANGGIAGSGAILGGGVNSTSASAHSTGTGSATAVGVAGVSSSASLSIENTRIVDSSNGTASVSSKVGSSTANSGYASTYATSTGNGVAQADSAAIAGSAVGYVVVGGVRASDTVGVIAFGGLHGSFGAVSAESDSVHGSPSELSGAAFESTSMVNAVGGVQVKDCRDIATLDGKYTDDKTATASVVTFGRAEADAGAGAVAGGVYFGAVNGAAQLPQ